VRQRIGVADEGRSWSAVTFDLPGCLVSAASRRELLELAPIAVASHLAWLWRSGLDATRDAVELDIEEEICAADHDAADGEFCFNDDLRPTSVEDIDRGVAIMERSRADLLDAVRGVSDAILDWRPPATAMARVDEWNPQPRTIREIMSEVASAEAYYCDGLLDGAVSSADGGNADPVVHRSRLVATLRSLNADDRARRFEPVRSWQETPEHWTARKVIRRVISHERFHTAEIQQQLSWLLVGVPRFRPD
jgi:hypothetical protein